MDSEVLDNIDDNDIKTMLELYLETNTAINTYESFKEALKNKIKVYMKTRKWERYKDDDTKIGVSLTTQRREILNKEELKHLLSEGQLAAITKITTFEKLNITTPETRERLKQYVRKKIN